MWIGDAGRNTACLRWRCESEVAPDGAPAAWATRKMTELPLGPTPSISLITLSIYFRLVE
jgi:hypothetical protein